MLLSAAAARVTPGGFVAVYGAKDEGIRSVDKHRPESIGEFETQWVKRRCRVLVARASSTPADAQDDALETWRSDSTIDWGDGPRRWAFYPGMFAHGRLDPATELLVDHLPPVPKGARILDYGAGSGIIGAALLDREPTCTVDLLDVDAVALAAAAINVPAAGRIHAADLSSATGTYDLIVSNPPVHEGKTETLRIVRCLAQGATRVLGPKGSLTLVVQRRLGAESLLKASFGTVRIVG